MNSPYGRYVLIRVEDGIYERDATAAEIAQAQHGWGGVTIDQTPHWLAIFFPDHEIPEEELCGTA